jgi:molecular chaperone GrpE
MSNDELAVALLPVLDHLELALRHADSDPATVAADVRAAHARALDVLAGLGLRRLDALGQPFDPARHDAAREVPAAEGVEPGTVVDVDRAGYVDGAGALIRAAVVTVAQAPGPSAAEGEGR